MVPSRPVAHAGYSCIAHTARACSPAQYARASRAVSHCTHETAVRRCHWRTVLRPYDHQNKQDPLPHGQVSPMPIVQADRLTRIGSALLKAAGASEEEADAVAVGCVNANLAGHDSHGVIAIPTYIDRITAGHIVPGATWTIVQESPTTTVIDGHWGFGFHVNAKAMALTIE